MDSGAALVELVALLDTSSVQGPKASGTGVFHATLELLEGLQGYPSGASVCEGLALSVSNTAPCICHLLRQYRGS